jgi:hypothetical protein
VLETPMEPAVSGALTKLQARQDARVAQVMTSFAPGANGRTALVASWRPVPGFRDRPERLEVEARGADGAALAAGEATLATDGTGAVRLEVPAGEATLRFTAHGASGDIVDRWDEPVKVPDLSGRTFDLASPQFLRALNTAAFQALRKGGGGTPSPDREFRASDLIVVRTAVATGDGPDAKVQAEVLTREGKPLAAWPASTVGGEHQVELPVRSLALGEYVLRFTATRGDETAMSTAGFAIVR